MLRKLWKILWISALSFIGFVIIVATLVSIFVPEEELEKASAPPPEQQVSPPEPTEATTPTNRIQARRLGPNSRRTGAGGRGLDYCTRASRWTRWCIKKIQGRSPQVIRYRPFEWRLFS